MSPNFSYQELTFSQEAVRKGLRNDPSERQQANLLRLCTSVLEPLRAAVGRPVVILSAFRSLAVNEAIGGAKHSEHIAGRAADVIVAGMSPLELCEFAVMMNLPFNQVIHEFGRWMHISIPELNFEPKREVLTARKDVNGKTFYLRGLV